MIKEGKRGKTDMASFTFINYGWVWFGLFSVFYFFIFCVLEKQTHPPKRTSTKGIIITLTNNNKQINIFF